VIGGEPCACARVVVGIREKNLAAVAKSPPVFTWPAANGNEVFSTLPQRRSVSAAGWLSCLVPWCSSAGRVPFRFGFACVVCVSRFPSPWGFV
jgi:hypothetical protein